MPPGRRKAAVRRISRSPRLARALRQQVRAVEAVRRLADPAPAGLRQRIERLCGNVRRLGARVDLDLVDSGCGHEPGRVRNRKR
jgi:hypothetical protein